MSNTALARRQQDFMAQVLDDEAALPDGWNKRHAAGMEIYRNAYRARLVDALRDTYERTAKWTGEDAFRKAAAHHVITRPPNSWTLDDVGEGFPEVLAELFTNNPEVAELGWLEWAMHRAFVAADAEPIDVTAFGNIASGFAEEDWANMRIVFLPGTMAFPITQDIGKLWCVLGDEDSEAPDLNLDAQYHCVVWREDIKPVFIQVTEAEGRALTMMQKGATYGEACAAMMELLGEEQAVAEAGAMLGRWVHNGLIASIERA